MNIINSRKIALKILNKFYSSSITVEKIINDFFTVNEISNKDKTFINEIVNGVIRWQIKIDFILNLHLTKNISKLHPLILNILRIAIYQLFFLDKVPNFAIVNEAVNLTKQCKLNSFSGFINAILRKIISEKQDLNLNQNDINNFLSVEFSHPLWLVNRLISQFGIDETKLILDSNNHRSQITFRVNLAKSSVAEVEDFLRKEEIIFAKNELLPNCFSVLSKTKIVNSKLFQDGKITIQDASSMLCASLTVPSYSDLIFDLCAAPGGKTCYIAEQILLTKNDYCEKKTNGKIIANDIFSHKIKLIKENAKRLGFENIEYICGDALDFGYSKYNEKSEKADIILLDVPCSGIGTISRNPDIKHLRQEKDFNDLLKLQRKLLLKASELLKVGGALIYSTCSIDKEENAENIKWFLQNNNQFSLESADKYIEKSYCESGFLQCFSHKHSTQNFRIDGAFAARLVKNY